jgi:hypothetical protein
MSRVATVLALAVLAFAGAPAMAEDDTSWTFDVLEVVHQGDDDVLVRLKPAPLGRKFPRSCDELTIHSTFAPRKVQGSGRRTNRDEHVEALRALLQAQAEKRLIRVGSIDTGFGAIPNKPKCEVSSRVLRRLLEDDDVWAIYSFY